MGETIIQGNVLEEYVKDMQTYAIVVNRLQSVPDVKDGLKKVARRVMTSAYFNDKLYYNGPFHKCAGLVGSTLANYHPRGDSSVYGVIVSLCNWFDTKMPLLEGHGNFGNMIGKGPAAYRYTECKLSEFGQECVIGDLSKSKEIVDWVPNFNESCMEPEYLPAKVPLLLINGTLGIGVGMKCDVPTHNLAEVIDATLAVIDDPNAKVVLIPDHYMGCDIVDTNWKAISNTGQGNYRVRAHIDIEMRKDVPYLHIRGVPNAVTLFRTNSNKSNEGVIAKIEEMMKDGRLPQVKDVYSDSKGDNLDYVVQLNKGTDPYYVKEYLYKNTLLENSYRVNFEVLDGIDIRRFSYKSYIEYFIEFALTLKFRGYAAQYQKAKTEFIKTRLYIMILESGEIENIQRDIRNMKDVSPEAKAKYREKLIKKFKVTDIEAQYIMDMDQTKAAIGYLPIYKQKAAELDIICSDCFTKMNDDNLLKQELKEELIYYKKKYGTPRMCKVVKAASETIPKGEFRVVITENNYIKKISLTDPINTYRGDAVKFTLKVDNTENILLFDKYGRVFKLPVHKIALCDKNAQGFDLRLMIKNCTSDIISVMYEPKVLELSKKNNKNFLVVVTAGNCIKKLDLDDFLNIPLSGILYTKLNEQDFVKDIAIVPNNLDVVLYSDRKALRFNMSEIPHYKRSSVGVIGMNTNEEIDGLSVIYPNAEFIVVVTKSGKVNKFNISGMKLSNRAKAGSSVIKLGKTDSIMTIYGLPDTATLRAITKSGIVDKPISEIPVQSSISAGVKMFSDLIKTTIIK